MNGTTLIRGRASQLLTSLTIVALLAGSMAQASAAELLAGVARNGRLVLFSSDAASPGVNVRKVRGLQKRERLIAVDVRPLTGELYGLSTAARIYTIDYLSGNATAIGTEPFTNALSGTSFGFDFNPVVDRIRIVSDSGLNIRVNPTNGTLAASDTDLAYATGDSGEGLAPTVVAVAYINNDTNDLTGTTLYDIDSNRDVLAIQNPPNTGTLTTVGLLGLDVVGVAGFDVSGADGTAYAALIPAGQRGNSARASLYTIDLATGAATLVKRIAGPKPLTSLTVLGPIE
jgi:hypothetical protein